MKKISLLLTACAIVLAVAQKSYAHCEIPCGIYDDQLRIDLIKEHISTIEKSMNQINTLSGEKKPNQNQLIRWVMNKEEHAKKIQDIVSQYFLHQRIKLGAEPGSHEYGHYVQKLALLHQILVYSMKAKQTTDLSYIQKLRETVEKFEKAYFSKHEHKH